MGDRGLVNVAEGQDDVGVFLYTHWKGTKLPLVVKNVLKKQTRWDDQPYLARMIFCRMLRNDGTSEGNIDDSTGYGISNRYISPEHPIIRIDTEKQMVYFVSHFGIHDAGDIIHKALSSPIFKATMELFTQMSNEMILEEYIEK